MKVRPPCAAFACALFLSACAENGPSAPELSPNFALSGNPPTHLVTGGGTVPITIDGEELRSTYALQASMDQAGSVSGQIEIHLSSEPWELHGAMACLAVEGNGAWLGFVITRSDATRERWQVGQEVVFRVQDRGEGAGSAPDRVSTFYPRPAAICADRLEYPLRDWTNGNVQINSLEAGRPDNPGPSRPFYLAENGVTVMCSDAAVGQTGTIGGVEYTKRDRAGLDALVAAGKSSGDYGPLGTSCTSGITDMTSLFDGASTFNENIGSWDVSSVTSMEAMFNWAFAFDQPIGAWDVSNVTSFNHFIRYSAFNQDIGAWDVSSATDMSFMFDGSASFNQDISGWDVSKVTSMFVMFYGAAAFNQDISGWDVSNVQSMGSMFTGATAFDQPIGTWDVSNVVDMYRMFGEASSFDQDISAWNVSKVTTLAQMFGGATAFNQPLSSWNVSNVTDMNGMFNATSFNQDIGAWDVSKVTSMSGMFAGSPFNQDIGAWDVSSVSDMNNMFGESPFDRDISGWDVSSVITMASMFERAAAFNQDLSGWNVSSVTDMSEIFRDATLFNADLSGWCVTNIPTAPADFDLNATSWTLARPLWGTCPGG